MDVKGDMVEILNDKEKHKYSGKIAK